MSKVDVTVQQYLRSRLPLDAKFGPYATIAARNLIPAEDRYPMMVVGVEDTDGFGTNAIYFLKDGVTNSDWELIAFGSGQSYQPQEQTWVWSDGIDAGGVHLDFVIPGAIAGEVASIDSCILFVGGSVQRNTTDFELQTTTVLNDTIRILNTTAAEREATVTVQLWYNRVGEGIPLPTVLFTQLQDVPSSYVGQAGKFVSVKGTEDALEFIDIVLPSKNIPAFTTAINKTISGGVLAIGDDRHIIVNAESGTVDDLTEITGTNLEEGDVISITVAAGDTITAFSEWSPSAYQLKLQIDRQFILRAGFTYEFILEDLSLGLTWVQLNDPSFTKYPAFQNLQNRTIDDSGGQLSISSNGRRIAVASWDGSTVQDLTELNTSQYNEGEIILLTAQTGETITVKHNATAGGFKLIGGQDVILDEINPLMLMKHSDGYWHQLNNLSDIKGSQIEGRQKEEAA